MPGPPVSFLELFQNQHDSLKEELHTAMPAQVLSFDHATRTCVVQPQVRVPVFNADGSLDQTYELPTISDVPVAFFRGGGFFFAWDLAAGDNVFLVFSETAMGQWRTSGGVSDPVDVARHSLGYPVAFPCLSPDTVPFVDGQAGKLVIGKEGDTGQVVIGAGSVQVGKGASNPAAFGNVNDANMSALHTFCVAVVADLIAAAAAPGTPYVATAVAPTFNTTAATVAKVL